MINSVRRDSLFLSALKSPHLPCLDTPPSAVPTPACPGKRQGERVEAERVEQRRAKYFGTEYKTSFTRSCRGQNSAGSDSQTCRSGRFDFSFLSLSSPFFLMQRRGYRRHVPIWSFSSAHFLQRFLQRKKKKATWEEKKGAAISML